MNKVELGKTGVSVSEVSNLDQLDHNLKALDVSLCEEQMNILNKASV